MNDNDTIPILNRSTWFTSKSPLISTETSRSQIQQKHCLNHLQIIEICSLCFILIEHTIIFLLTFPKRTSKERFIDNTNEQQPRSIIFPTKSLLYNCLHRNWIRAYSFSNICLSLIYLILFILKFPNKTLVYHTSDKFHTLALTLIQQILINFTTFHLFIMSISILQYFIRYYRLLNHKYSLNIYNVKNLLITKHTNVALILSGSLALIFSYNYIFYTPNYSLSVILLPLITLNMVLLALIDWIILLFIIISCFISLYNYDISLSNDTSFDNQPPQQQLANSVRSTIEKSTCIKCYSKFLKENRNFFQDNDPYTKLHSRFLNHRISSARPSLTCPEDKRKYSTLSYENIPMINDINSRSRVSYTSQPTRKFLLSISSTSQQDCSNDQQQQPPPPTERNSTNELFIETTLLRFKEQRSLCHLCYCLLLLFLFKYVVLTFPQHYIQMKYYFKLFNRDILRRQSSPTKSSEYIQTICRLLYLIARFGDSLLLTRISFLIKKYFPCWCHFNSKFFQNEQTLQRPSDQTLMKNTDSSVNETISADDLSNQQESQQKQSIRTNHRRFRLRFQFVPIWSNKRQRLFKENCRFHTYSTGFISENNEIGYNYTQIIQCTPNKERSKTTHRTPVHYLKQSYTRPIYKQNEKQLQWYIGPIVESKESPTCPFGFEQNGSFCQICNDCRVNTCEIGYRRNYESGLCEDIDECSEHNNLCQYMCENQVGSYRCFCPIGFKMDDLGQCQDVNECNQFQIECGQDRTCFNTRGAYECIDIPCPVGYIHENKSDCILKCHQRSPSSCPPRRALSIRYRFIAIPRLTSSNSILFSLPIKSSNDKIITIINKTNLDISFPFILDGINLKTNRTLLESNEYEFEIYLYNNQLNKNHRRRLETIYILRINISPFHF